MSVPVNLGPVQVMIVLVRIILVMLLPIGGPGFMGVLQVQQMIRTAVILVPV